MPLEDLLDKTIIIQRKTLTADGHGGFTEAWTDLATVQARLQPLRGRERFAQDKQTLYATHAVFLPPLTDVTQRDRLKYGTRLFDVRWVRNPEEVDHHLELDVEEIA